MKNKTGRAVRAAFEEIFEETKPLYMMSDLGGEFYCRQVQNLLKKYDISHYPMRNSVKSNYSERAIGWIKRKIYLYMAHYEKKRYADILKTVQNSWNSDKRKNPSGIPPNKITLANQTKVFYSIYENIYKTIGWAKKIAYSVGDSVRIAIERPGNAFTKSYKPKFSQEIYKISRILKGSPVRYGVETLNGEEQLEGTWYSMELRPVVSV